MQWYSRSARPHHVASSAHSWRKRRGGTNNCTTSIASIVSVPVKPGKQKFNILQLYQPLSQNCSESNLFIYLKSLLVRAVARSENLGGHVILGGENVPPRPLVEIGLTDLPKSGGHVNLERAIQICAQVETALRESALRGDQVYSKAD